jgi:type I protein arginine methyltransferase
MLNEREIESCYLGQFIPVQYHHNMLMDQNRMHNFKCAIDYAVAPGAKVLELGGGTGVLSFFAAQKADKVYCVEFNPDLVQEARRFLAINENGHKVDVIQGDAFEYLPPEPVDVVICEMLHVAMVREKQVDVIEQFKQRYLERFGGPLPRFIPEAVLLAVQPLQKEYDFEGFRAPIVQFEQNNVIHADTVQLGNPVVYGVLDFTQAVDALIAFDGQLVIEQAGELNALRFINKNVLTVVQEEGGTIDWLMNYMSLPLAEPLKVVAGDIIDVSFRYRAGGSLPSLQTSVRASFAQPVTLQETAAAAEFA